MSLQSTAGSPTPPPTARTTTTTGGPAMHGDDAQPEGAVAPANDNAPVLRTAAVDAALTRLAEAIGRHIAREHIRELSAAKDNEACKGRPTRSHIFPPCRYAKRRCGDKGNHT